MSSPKKRSLVSAFRRALSASIGLAILMPTTLGSSAPALAEDDNSQYGGYVGQQATARFELEIKTVHIYDDRDWDGAGDIRLTARIWQMKQADNCPRWTNRGDCIIELAKLSVEFPASGGANVPITRTLPDDGPDGWVLHPSVIGPGIGIPVYAGEVYGWEIAAVDKDLAEDDRMGWLRGEMSEANGWGTPGEYHERGWVVCDDQKVFGFCIPGAVESPFNPPDAKPAHFNVLYELRHTPLPDFRARDLRYDPVRDALCMTVQNVGARPSGPFDVTIRADKTSTFDGWNQSLGWLGLGVNESREQCVGPLIPAGPHYVTFFVNEGGEVPEMDERNNLLRGSLNFVGRGAQPNGVQSPSGPQSGGSTNPPASLADLNVSAIRIKGKEPSGSNDCDPGKNDITLALKNDGAAATNAFVVQLKVDDDDEYEKSVPNLDAGKSLEVTFDDVRLKKRRPQAHRQSGCERRGS